MHLHRDWGATREEIAAVLPGDELVPEPAERTTLAVTVDTAGEDVWPWLVQMGQGRGGMYSYDWLEDLLGLDIHTADEIRAEWQDLAVGDQVVVVPEGHRLVPAGYAFRVARMDARRALGPAPGSAGAPVERGVVLPRRPCRRGPLPTRVPVPHRGRVRPGTARRHTGG